MQSDREPAQGIAWGFAPGQLVPATDEAPRRRSSSAFTDRLPAVTKTARFRLVVVVVATVVAYHYSLTTLMRTLGLDTPLAYLGLVPFMALGLAAMRGRPGKDEPDIHDRQVDLIVGLPLVAAALVLILLLPGRLGTLFWVYRIDLLSLPLFVAGLVTLVFGVRTMFRLRFPIGFLFLAWPVPFSYLLDHGLTSFTGVTLFSLRSALSVLPINAVSLPSGDGSLFSIGTGADAFQVSVASACAGVDGVVGFLLVGVAFVTLVQGRRLPKYLWLIAGLSLIYSLNLFRLLLLFWAGDHFGEAVAIDGLHPFIGLMLFCLGVGVMIRFMGLFGLTIATEGAAEPPSRKERRAARKTSTPIVTTAPTVRPTSAPRPRWVLANGLRGVGALTLVVALVLGVANSGMKRFELFAGDLGAPRLASFLSQPLSVQDYSVTQIAQYDWAQRFFGSDSTWRRYQYVDVGARGTLAAAATPSLPVIADVVQSDSLRRFATYGIEACYRFHGYDIQSQSRHDLGGGVQADLITYSNPDDNRDWNALYWIWPVTTDDGTRYERVVLLSPSARTLSAAGPGGAAAPQGDQAEMVRSQLVNFGGEVVASAASAASATEDSAADATAG